MCEFKVGDEVRYTPDEEEEQLWIITNIEEETYCDRDPEYWISVINTDGYTYNDYSQAFEKTGRSFLPIIERLLQSLKEENA